MSKKARLRKRFADLDITTDETENTELSSKPSKGFVIKNKYTLNAVHKTFLDLCLYEKTKMVFVDGPAGTAKTFIAVLSALTLLQQKRISKIVYIRSIVESAEKSIGALPGEVNEKFKPWSLPMLDKLNELLPDSVSEALIAGNVV